MERSSNSVGGPLAARRRLVALLDRVALAALGAGLALYVLPFWREGRLRPAFWLTLGATLLHVYTSHGKADDQAPSPSPDPGSAA